MAALFRPELPGNERFRHQLAVMGEFMDIFQRNESIYCNGALRVLLVAAGQRWRKRGNAMVDVDTVMRRLTALHEYVERH